MRKPSTKHEKRISIQALTLVEMMITMGIFSLTIAAMIAAHIFGLQQDQLVQSECGASASARRGFQEMQHEIRSCKLWDIGTTSGSGPGMSFTPITLGTTQRGNAVRINLTTATNRYVIYYFDSSDPINGILYRFHSTDGAASVVADNLYNSGTFPSNSLCFTSENYSGTIQTDRTHVNVIHTILEFKKYQYPTTVVGPDQLFVYYKMELKLTPHVPD